MQSAHLTLVPAADAPLAALRDDALAAIAARSSGRVSVIVEAQRPEVVPLRRRAASADALLPPRRRGSRTAAAAAPADEAPADDGSAASMAALQATLDALGLAAKARRNDLAGAFVVEVTPRQLRALAAAPAVQAIRPNRFRRRAVAL